MYYLGVLIVIYFLFLNKISFFSSWAVLLSVCYVEIGGKSWTMFSWAEKVTSILGYESKLTFSPQHRNMGLRIALFECSTSFSGILVGVAVYSYFPHASVWVTFTLVKKEIPRAQFDCCFYTSYLRAFSLNSVGQFWQAFAEPSLKLIEVTLVCSPEERFSERQGEGHSTTNVICLQPEPYFYLFIYSL